jgi:hypothetical protein
MALNIKRETPKPVELPIEEVTIGDGTESGSRRQRRSITVRPHSERSGGGLRTIVCRYDPLSSRQADRIEFKWLATLGDLRTFGEALIAIADGK